ncbi:hypothetical protein JXA88_03090 [Candidatus Fermentibacteria bacterium]|nr:hypothetical protein [Candidatus Fermentibacteria bacterium]
MPDHPPRPPWPAMIAVPVVIFLCWALPRLAVQLGGIEGPWTPFLYQYFLGGLVFAIGLVVIRVSGACDFRRPGDRTWFTALVLGYVAYALMHGTVTWLAYAIPFKGVQG